MPGESNKIRIVTVGTQSHTFIAHISGVPAPAGVGVIVGTDGKLGTVVSSSRYKEAIQRMDKASEAILALEPVTLRYKHELDPEGVSQFGLVAEQVEKVNPRAGGSRRRWQSLYRPLRGGERDVAKRVPQRAPQG